MAKHFLLFSALLLVGVCTGGHADGAIGNRLTDFNINFVNFCDGLDLVIRNRTGIVTGTHSGCGSGEFVIGQTFTNADGEQGVVVQYFDRTIRRPQTVQVFTVGFRAGNFYMYDNLSGQLLRLGQWEVAPPAP